MEDRELLEWAAKAAGFGAPDTGSVCWTASEYPIGSGKNGALWNYVGHCGSAELWNPLTDDGDALRLAVKLGLLVDTAYNSGSGVSSDRNHGGPPEFWSSHQGDAYAATRRAIVRAAAEIGRAALTAKD